MKLGSFALGSPYSRAAARSLLAARKISELKRSPGNLNGLAEHIRAARMRLQDSELPVSLAAKEARQRSDVGGRLDCLSERMRRARERVARAEGSQIMPISI
jgi:hypothetical protein